ncbi:uncharacterized protein V1518DRAFT_175290 [Limtongia smithiae]|uniref:uncharacterized protein n=1 Tax=Limtongia smithiae TaxID=1125753 RepID=UPI0034CF86A5
MDRDGDANDDSILQMTRAFDLMVKDIADRISALMQQTCDSAEKQHEQCVSIAEDAAFKIEGLRSTMSRCDELELEFSKIKRIAEIVKEFRNRVVNLENII